MKINTAPLNVAEINGGQDTGEFTIRNSAKAFSILSSGLYSNKIQAIIRELSCNAVDSHVDAGRSAVPFDVQLPNRVDPTFKIRDYGTGLTHEQVMKLYTTYFESTKTESNDFIGALGLGSKSPFSYTDNFTVTSIKDGQQGIYTAFINDQGVPSIVTLSQTETSESDGLCIQFAVKDQDHHKFSDEARYVYRYFKTRPNVTGYRDFDFEDIQYVEDNFPGVYERATSNYHTAGLRAVMGNIAYPIEVPDALEALGPELYNVSTNCQLDLFFELGEIEFAANREALSYVPLTVNSIRDKLQSVVNTVAAELGNRVEALKSQPWEQAALLLSYNNKALTKAASLVYAKQIVDDNPYIEIATGWRGGEQISSVPVELGVRELREKYNIELRGFEFHESWRRVANHRVKKIQSQYLGGEVEGHGFRVRFHDKPQFVIADCPGAMNRVREHVRNLGNKATEHYVIAASDKTKPVKVKAFLKRIGCTAKYTSNASDFERPARSGSSAPRVKSEPRVDILTERDYSRSRYSSNVKVVWDKQLVEDIVDDGITTVYLITKTYEVQKGKYKGSNAKEVMEEWFSNRYVQSQKFRFVSISVQTVKDIGGVPTDWVRAEDFLEQCIATITDEELMKFSADIVDYLSTALYGAMIKELDSGFFWEAAKRIMSVASNAESSSDFYHLSLLLNEAGQGDRFKNLVAEYKELDKTLFDMYPMLVHLGRYSLSPRDVTHAADYIKLVEANSKEI